MMPYEFSSVAVGLVAQRAVARLIRIDLAMMLTGCVVASAEIATLFDATVWAAEKTAREIVRDSAYTYAHP
jgi:hypothetical protein